MKLVSVTNAKNYHVLSNEIPHPVYDRYVSGVVYTPLGIVHVGSGRTKGNEATSYTIIVNGVNYTAQTKKAHLTERGIIITTRRFIKVVQGEIARAKENPKATV